MISVRAKLQKTLLPWLPELVSIYIKLLPIGGKAVVPLSPVGEFVFVVFINFCILLLFFLSLAVITQFSRR